MSMIVTRKMLLIVKLSFNTQNDSSKLDRFAAAMLHGKGYDRWFDKSFTFVVLKNGRVSLPLFYQISQL